MGGMRSLWGRFSGFSISGLIDKLAKYAPAIKTIQAAADDPDSVMAPFVGGIADQLTDVPERAQGVIAEKSGGAGPEQEEGPEPASTAASAAPAGGVLARTPVAGSAPRQIQREERTPRPGAKMYDGLCEAVVQKWAKVNVKAMIKDMLWTLVWPWPTVSHEFSQMLTEWKAAVGTFYMPRNLFEDPLGCLHDVYSNLLKVLDFPIILWRHLMNAGMALMGWVTLFLVIAGAIQGAAAGTIVGGIAGALAGAGVGAAPGAAGGGAAAGLAGAGAGFGVALSIGEVLVIGYAAGELAAITKALLELKTGRQTKAEQARDFNQVTDSGIGLAILGARWPWGGSAAGSRPWWRPGWRRCCPTSSSTPPRSSRAA